MQSTIHVYEVRPRKDKRGDDLVSDALPFGRLWYGGPNAISNAFGYAQIFSRSHALSFPFTILLATSLRRTNTRAFHRAHTVTG